MSGYSVRTVPRGRAEATLPPDTRLERWSIAGYSDATWVTRDRRERAHCCGACARKRLVRERDGSGVGRDCFFFPGHNEIRRGELRPPPLHAAPRSPPCRTPGQRESVPCGPQRPGRLPSAATSLPNRMAARVPPAVLPANRRRASGRERRAAGG